MEISEGQIARFWSKVEMAEEVECWLWSARLLKGYGVVTIRKRAYMAHRVAYELYVGPIPDGFEVDHLEVDHLCFTPRCVNPRHLQAVTPEENHRRAREAGRFNIGERKGRKVGTGLKTHCKRGHELSPDNVRTYPTKTGGLQRNCRACDTIRARERAAAA